MRDGSAAQPGSLRQLFTMTSPCAVGARNCRRSRFPDAVHRASIRYGVQSADLAHKAMSSLEHLHEGRGSPPGYRVSRPTRRCVQTFHQSPVPRPSWRCSRFRRLTEPLAAHVQLHLPSPDRGRSPDTLGFTSRALPLHSPYRSPSTSLRSGILLLLWLVPLNAG